MLTVKITWKDVVAPFILLLAGTVLLCAASFAPYKPSLFSSLAYVLGCLLLIYATFKVLEYKKPEPNFQSLPPNDRLFYGMEYNLFWIEAARSNSGLPFKDVVPHIQGLIIAPAVMWILWLGMYIQPNPDFYNINAMFKVLFIVMAVVTFVNTFFYGIERRRYRNLIRQEKV